MIKVLRHPIQVIFALIHSLLIVSGCLFTTGIMKSRGYPDPSLTWHSFPIFVQDWGFLFLLIPVGWVLSTLWFESNPRHRSSRRWSILSGALLVVALLFLFLASAVLAGGAGTILRSAGS